MLNSEELLSHWRTLDKTDLGTSNWLNIDQTRINAFADATLDHQVIHVDDQATATQKIGGTIAHGFLSLSLLSHFNDELTKQHIGGHTVLNYGLNRVRFLSPVPSNSDIRLHMKVLAVESKPQGILVTFNSEVEIRGQSRPAFIAEQLILLLY